VIGLWGLAPLWFGLVPEVHIVWMAMWIGGIVYAPYNIIAPTIQQRLVPDPVRGRVIGVYNLLGGIGFPLGVYTGGWLGNWLGPAAAIAWSGAATVLLGLVVMFLPALRFATEGGREAAKSE
jgi:MFS family permease